MKRLMLAIGWLGLVPAAIRADDADIENASGDAAAHVPTLVEITPAGVDLVIGFNRLEEAFDRAYALNEALGMSFPISDVRTQFEVGVGEGLVDYRGPLVVYAMSPFAYGDFSIDRLGVGGVVNDPRTARITLEAPDEVPDGEIFSGRFGTTRYVLPVVLRNSAIYVSMRNNVIRELLEQETLAGELDDELVAELNEADFVALARRGRMLDDFWRDYFPGIDRALNPRIGREPDPVEEQFRQLIRSVESIAFAGDVRYDAVDSEKIVGVDFGLTMQSDADEGSEPARFLEGLASDVDRDSMTGLPAGDIVVAFDGQFTSESHLSFVRHVTDLAADAWNNARHLPDSLVAEQFLAVFEEGGEHLQGMRLGVYRNEDFESHGSFSLLLIFDSEHPQAFVDEMRQLIRLASADELANVDEEVLTEDEIRELVSQLGDPVFRVRRSATNQLMLVGPPAIPYLREGLNSDSLELRTRAGVILEQMEALDTYESRHFLGSELFQGLKLEQRYVIGGERLEDGTSVDYITYAIADDEHQAFALQLATWLGPDWHRWRLAATDRNVVVLIGSRTDLLSQALANLIDDGSASPQFNAWGGATHRHQFELHFNGNVLLRGYRPTQSLPSDEIDVAGGNQGDQVAQRTGVADGSDLVSIGISMTEDAVHIDAIVPLSQLDTTFWPFRWW